MRFSVNGRFITLIGVSVCVYMYACRLAHPVHMQVDDCYFSDNYCVNLLI